MDSKILEIPFGAKDSELIEWSYTISEGMEAEIKDGKVIIRKKESEDEKIRKQLADFLEHLYATGGNTAFDNWSKSDCAKWIAYLEKQKEQKPAECIEFDNEFKNQVSHLLASVLNKEWEYDKGLVEYAAQQLLGYAKHEIKPVEWSEEDEQVISAMIRDYEGEIAVWEHKERESGKSAQKQINTYKGFISFIKSLCPQPKQEWSEEDSDMICEIIDHCITIPYIGGTLHLSDERKKELKTFVKSLRPQPHWKPSEEQIKAVDLAIRFVTDDFGEHPTLSETLRGLYNDIKKL